MTVAKKSINNEQNHDLLPGVLQGVAGKSDLAYLVSAAVIDGDRTGCDHADHIACLDHGSGFQLHSAFRIFVIQVGIVILVY